MRALVDTNFVIRARNQTDPLHPLCDTAIRTLLGRGDTLHWCAQVAIEYWSVATRPQSANGLGLTPADAEQRLRDLDQFLVWLPEPSDVGLRWRKIVNLYAVLGKQAHDARLVALMVAYGLTHLLTLNTTDFTRYTDITVLHPNDVQ